MKRTLLILLCTAILFCAACGGKAAEPASTENDETAAGTVKQLSAPAYPESSDVSWEEGVSQEFLNAMNGFAAESSAELLGKADNNAVYSPACLYMALALAASGASGGTLGEMYSAMGLSKMSGDIVTENVNKLFRELYGNEDYGHLLLYNSLWLSSEYSFNEDFLNNARESYFTEVYTLDPSAKYDTDPIAEWISEKTGGKLEYSPTNLDNIVMTLISTIDFYGEWTDSFKEDNNTAGDFTKSDGTKVTAEYMNKSSSGSFTKGDGWTMASIPCKSGAEMYFILPDEGTDIGSIVGDPEKMAELLGGNGTEAGSSYGTITWSVPKFDFTSDLDLIDLLKGMGMTSAFCEDADFSGISANKPLYIAGAKQSSRVAVNENGVSAASYTELMFAGSAMPTDKAEMILNRPFAFALVYRGVTLFTGVVGDPS